MVQYCCAFNCKTSAGNGYSFHKFPKDDNLYSAWCQAVRRRNFIPSEHSRLCSKHFTKEDYLRDETGYKRLKKEAIPSIFNFSNCIEFSHKKPEKTSFKHKRFTSKAERFPLNDPERLQKWLKALKRESWQPTKHSFLCSLHFTADSYKSNPKHFLKDDAVPTISCFSTDHPKIIRKKTIEPALPISVKKPASVSQKNVISEESSVLNCSSEPSSGMQNDSLHKSQKRSSNNSPFKVNDLEIYKDSLCDGNFIASDDEMNEFSDIEFSDSDDAKKRLEVMTAHYKKSRKKLKMCQQRCSLYKKEITALKEVIDSLRQINSVSDDN